VANELNAGNGGFGGGGGGAAGQFALAGQGGFGAGGGGTSQSGYNPGGAGAGIGGGIFVDSGTVSIWDCQFTNNQTMGGGGGSGIGPDFFSRAGKILQRLTATSGGGGTVTVDPADPPYLHSSSATVTTRPDAGWQFLGWLGDASGHAPTVDVHVNRNKFVQALFGTTLTSSALMSLAPESDYYPFGTVVKLTALPPAGTYFTSWSGDATGTNNPMSITVTNPNQSFSYQLGALSAGQFALTVVENGKGHVEASPSGSRYNTGQTVILSAVADVAQDFIGWRGDANGSENPLTVLMDASKIITANFTKRPTLRVGTPLEGLVEGGFRLTVLGEFGSPYSVLGSTNLLDWLPIGTVTNTYGTVQLTDPAGTQLSWRFYRAIGE
jgi:hypothetical protein